MIILPSTYLPSISYIAQIIEHTDECVVDVGEHYIKRSTRNRTRIMTAQGVMELSIPVRRANRPRQPMSTIEIDYSKRWQHQHWNAILSAYKSSPYFEHFEHYFEPLYREPFTHLVEFNEALMGVILKLLGVDKRGGYSISDGGYSVSEEYITAKSGDVDLRPKGMVEDLFEARPYIQVFDDRLDFEPNLSIIDLLFCEGTNALDFVVASRR